MAYPGITCRIQKPDIPRAGRDGAAHGGTARWGRAGRMPGRRVGPPRRPPTLVPSRRSNKIILGVSLEGRTKETLCNPVKTKPAVDNRLITDLSAGQWPLFVLGCWPEHHRALDRNIGQLRPDRRPGHGLDGRSICREQWMITRTHLGTVDTDRDCSIFTCRFQNKDIPRVGRVGAVHSGAAGRGRAGQDGTPTDRFAQETTDPRTLQGIQNTLHKFP